MFQHKPITKRIFDAAFEVGNDLGYGHLELAYKNATVTADELHFLNERKATGV